MAAAFIRVRRQTLPTPAEIDGARPGFEEPRQGFRERDQQRREPGARPEQSDRPRPAFYENDGEPMVWFRTSVGRTKKADPKWLLPLICRLGGVTKKDVGAIRITDSETRFQITAEASQGFVASLETAGENEIRIEQADGPPTQESTRPRGDFPRSNSRPPRRDGRDGDRPDFAARKARFAKPDGGVGRSMRSRAKG